MVEGIKVSALLKTIHT